MNKYFIDIIDKSFLAANSTNAASKPRTDTMRTAIRCGYKPVILNCYWRFDGMPHSIKEKIQKKAYWMTLRWQMRKLKSINNSEVFIQYPFLSPLMIDGLNVLKSNGNKLIVLFHDFYMLREGRTEDKMEQWLLKNADIAIVHTEPMKEVFQRFGFVGEIKLLHYFDYLQPAQEIIFKSKHSLETESNNILYAGNLEKSGFVKKLKNIPVHPKTNFFLYGKPKVESKKNIIYKGSFDSEHIEDVEGNWGLVWDGDSVDTCSGSYGEYLKYNAPFKFSLYLALGIPVIVWKESAMASYINDEHIGVCVDNLQEISDKIKMLTNEDVKTIQQNVQNVSIRVREGKMLESALS